MSDSGGFQVYSLIRQNPDYGTIRPNEVIFRDPETSQKWQFSPERSVQMQFQIGSDAVVCLDDCTDATASPAELEASVDRTIRWAARCKAEFERLTAAATRAETPATLAGGCPGWRQPGASRPLRARAGGDRLRRLRLRRLADHTRRRPARRSAGGCRQLRPTRFDSPRARHRATGSPRLGLEARLQLVRLQSANPRRPTRSTLRLPTRISRLRSASRSSTTTCTSWTSATARSVGRSTRAAIARAARDSRGPTCSICSRLATLQANGSPRSTTCASIRGSSISCGRLRRILRPRADVVDHAQTAHPG